MRMTMRPRYRRASCERRRHWCCRADPLWTWCAPCRHRRRQGPTAPHSGQRRLAACVTQCRRTL